MRRVIGTMGSMTLLLSFVFVGSIGTALAAPQRNKNDGHYQHIFVIMMENHSTDQIFGNTADAPFINGLASKAAVSTDYFGVTHPSLPNYLAAISGDFQHIWDDCAAGPKVTCAPEEFGTKSGYTNGQEWLTPQEIAKATNTAHWFNDTTIVDQLEAHGMSWKAYMQSLPYTGYTGEYFPYETVNGQQVPIKLYAQKHNPFDYFPAIRNNPERLKKVVPFRQFASDLDSGKVPNFVWVSPDQRHDMHGVSTSNAKFLNLPACAFPASGLDHSIIQLGDQFLQKTVNEITDSSTWRTTKSALVIMWDENDYTSANGCCHSPTGVNGVVLGGSNAPALVLTSRNQRHFEDSTDPFNHYSLLATIEKLWNLECLEDACGFSGTQLMTKFFV
jgi:phosphatidylinositol-3-phosphatase